MGRYAVNMHRGAMTLVETVFALVAIGGALLVASTGFNKLSEEARSAKCLNNLHRAMDAVLASTVEHNGILPGPVHHRIAREMHSLENVVNPEADRQKSLTWVLRPYITPGAPSTTDPALPNPIVDELFRCPTATMIVPDDVFFNMETGSCWAVRPYSYVANTWGPIASPGTTFSLSASEWNSTDPPHYFGAWFYCDPTPVRSDISWQPKRLDTIPNPSAEWALADAWYRQIPSGGGRGGSFKRRWLGTSVSKSAFVLAAIPDRPYHGINPDSVSSHHAQNADFLPEIILDGATNHAYFDGHVAPSSGDWRFPGNGGTVNPYWEFWGGMHPFSQPWYP